MRCLWRQCWDLLSLRSLQLASRPKHWDCLLFFFLFFHFFFFFFFWFPELLVFTCGYDRPCSDSHSAWREATGNRTLQPLQQKKNPDLETNRQKKKKNSKISRTKKTETNSWSHNCTLGVLANTNTTREKQSLCRIWFIGDGSNREYFQSAMDGNPSRKQRLQPAGGAAGIY